MADWVPLFPLPNVVLLPRVVLPLHIFEERYKAMTADALEADRRIGMALLLPGWEKSHLTSPPISPVVCVGEIIRHEKLSDGRYNFLLQGLTRAHVLREERIGQYRVAEVEPLEAPPTMEIDLLRLRQKLTDVLTGPLSRQPLSPQFAELLTTVISTSDAADVMAFHLIESLQEKQLLLEDPDPRTRIARLLNHLELLAQTLQRTNKFGPNIGLN